MNMLIVPTMNFFPEVELFQLLSPRGYLDTGVEMPAGGRVYLAEVTSVEIGRAWGGISKKEADAKDAKIAELEDLNASLIRHLKERDPLFQALKLAISDDDAAKELVA